MNQEENDLLQLCQSIVDTGQFSEEDARNLSEYINAAPNVHDSWPGNLLIKPLQKVWEDGVIDSNELEALAELLVSIVQPDYSPFDQESNLHVQVGLKSGKDLPPVIQPNSVEGESFIPPEAFIESTDLEEVILKRAGEVSELGFSSEEDILARQKTEQKKFITYLNGFFEFMNRAELTSDEISGVGDELDSQIGQEGLRKLIDGRADLAEHVEGVFEVLYGDDEEEPEHWSNFFDEIPPEDLVRKCAGIAYCQATIESKTNQDILEAKRNLRFAPAMEGHLRETTLKKKKTKEPKATDKQVNYVLSLAPCLKEYYVKSLGIKQISGLIDNLKKFNDLIEDRELEDSNRGEVFKGFEEIVHEHMIKLIKSEL